MKKNLFIHILIYLIGISHWVFFFFFVDYYGYKQKNVINEFEFTKNDNYIIGKYENLSTVTGLSNSQNLKDNIYFKIPISIKKLSDRYLKGDKDFIISLKDKINIKHLFAEKKFTENDLYSEHKVLEVWKNSIENKTIPYHSSYGVGNNPKLDRFLNLAKPVDTRCIEKSIEE